MSSSSSLVTFRTENGRYLGWRNNKMVAIATQQPIPGETVHISVGPEEEFLTRVHADGNIAIGKRGDDDVIRFVGVTGGVITLVDEAFHWTPKVTPDGRLALATPEGRYLSPKGGGGGEVLLHPAARANAMKAADALLPSIAFAEWPRPKAPKPAAPPAAAPRRSGGRR